MSERARDIAARTATRRGMALMSGGMLAFILNDAIIKQVSKDLPSGQLIAVRGVFASLLLLALWRFAPALKGEAAATASLAQLLERPVLVRALFDAIATLLYLTALFHMPLANVTAINMLTPIVIALIVALAYGEPLAPGRWLAILIGFVGTLLIVQPKAADWNAWSLFAVASTLFHALRDLATRRIRSGVPSLLLTLSTALAVLLFALALIPFQGVVAMRVEQVAALLLAAVFLALGYFLLIASMRAGDITAIAPFRYSGLLFALLLGYLFFGELPNALAWVGIALLFCAGLAITRRA
ncbi:MAG: DMT family transporter [Casimicrobiaceae bacterium]|nr:DMT family transporter [Casimicrobiaceae bacterium]MCX8098388.1 DMT family transporter [Casimicrobiaceae bacterium]